MAKSDDNGFVGEDPLVEHQFEIARGIGERAGASHAVGGCDLNITDGQFFLGISIALDDGAFDRNLKAFGDHVQPVNVEKHRNANGQRGGDGDDDPDNFLSRHATPIGMQSLMHPIINLTGKNR